MVDFKMSGMQKSLFLLLFLFIFVGCKKQEATPSDASGQPISFIDVVHKKGVVDILPLDNHRLLSIGRDSLVILWQTDSARAIAFKRLRRTPVALARPVNSPASFWLFLEKGVILQLSIPELAVKNQIQTVFNNFARPLLSLPQKVFYARADLNLVLFDPLKASVKIQPFALNFKDAISVARTQPLLARFRDKQARLFDLRTFKGLSSVNLPRFNPRTKAPRLITFVDDHFCLAAHAESLWLIDWNRRQARILPRNHLAPITALTASNSLKMFFSGSMDKSIKVWDMDSQELKASLYGHFFNINRLVVIDSTQRLISASEDGTILIFDLHNFEMVKRLGAMEVALKSPWQLTITSVYPARSFKVGTDEYNVSERGSRLLKVNAEIKNISPADAIFFSSNFFIIDSSNARTPCVGLEDYVALGPDAYFKRLISPGKSIKGTFIFVIKAPYQKYRLTYETLPPVSLQDF